jgi:hypothetical protein
MAKSDPIEPHVVELTSGDPADIFDIEKRILYICRYVKYAVIKKAEHGQTIALNFPNKKLFDHPDYVRSSEEGCFSPRSIKKIGKCLAGCLEDLNQSFRESSLKIYAAVIINHDLPADGSFSREQELEKYNLLLEEISSGYSSSDKEIYFMKNM